MNEETFSILAADNSLIVGQKLYQQYCANCHGVIHTSTKKDRSAQDIKNAFGDVRAMQGLSNNLDSQQLESIAFALRSPKTSDGRLQFVCSNEKLANSYIHRLSNREIRNTIESILKDIDSTLAIDSELAQLVATLPTDSLSKKENTLLVTPELVRGQLEIAYSLASYLASSAPAKRNFPGTGGCLENSPITESCATSFINHLVRLAFRRPISENEKTNFSKIFFESSLGSDSDRIIHLAATVFMSPDFLYLIYDRGTAATDGSLNLTSFEVASKISYLITGAPPDAILRGLADSGAILSPDVAGAQALRLLKTNRGKSSFLRFFKEWTHYDQFEGLNYSRDVLNGQSLVNLKSAMEKEIEDFVIDTAIDNEGAYKDLLTSTASFIYDDSLAQVYGVINPFGKTNLSSQHRAGLLTRAAFLSKRSGPLTSPVKRGLLVKEAFLCEGVGSPPPDAPSMLDPLPVDTYLTTRERLEHLTMKPGTSCINCHSVMNNLGFPFEMYDTLGRVRTRERTFKSEGTYSGIDLAIDSKSETKELGNEVSYIRDAIDLSSKLSNNDKALACLSKKWNEFQMNRSPSSSDGCVLNESLNTLYGKNNQQGSIQEMIKNTVRSEYFRKWNYLTK